MQNACLSDTKCLPKWYKMPVWVIQNACLSDTNCRLQKEWEEVQINPPHSNNTVTDIEHRHRHIMQAGLLYRGHSQTMHTVHYEILWLLHRKWSAIVLNTAWVHENAWSNSYTKSIYKYISRMLVRFNVSNRQWMVILIIQYDSKLMTWKQNYFYII